MVKQPHLGPVMESSKQTLDRLGRLVQYGQMSFARQSDDKPRPPGDLAITVLGALSWLFLLLGSAAVLAPAFSGWGVSLLHRALGLVR